MTILAELPPLVILACAVIGLVAGFVKGTVGFAMPMILISGLGSLIAPDLALAVLIVPTLVSNLWQALRQGIGAAWGSARLHWRFLAIMLVAIALVAQVAAQMSDRVFFLAIGIPVVAFSAVQLAGWRPKVARAGRRAVEIVAAIVAGVVGGVSGVWGPPTVLYLTALDTPRGEQMRVQGVVYGAGSVALALAHLRSGILTAETTALSTLMLLPAIAGMALGFRVGDRMDAARFRQATLLVLVVAGLNLVRRGLSG